MEEADGLVTPNSLNWNGAWALVYAKAFQVAVEHTELDDGKETQHFGNLFTIYSRYVQSMVCIITCVCVFVYEREGDRQRKNVLKFQILDISQVSPEYVTI